MTVLTSLFEHVDRLVHADARASHEARLRHRVFVTLHLGLFALVLAVAPFVLACGHRPALWEAFGAAWLAVPLAASAYLSRTGRLDQAEAACLAAWGGFALTTTLTGGTSVAGGCALLMLLPLQACHVESGRLLRGALGGALAGALLLGLAWVTGLAPARPLSGAPVDAPLLAGALAYLFLPALAARLRRAWLGRRHRAEDRRFATLAAATGDLLLVYDRAAGVLSASREAEALFGIAPRSLMGRGFFERVHVADRPAFLKVFSDAAEAGGNAVARLRLRTGGHESGGAETIRFAWAEVRARRLDAPSAGEEPMVTVLALVRDITGQVEHDSAMARAKEEAERASAWKDSFLANVSHELRTPLNAIIGFSEMLASTEFSPRDPAKQREYAAIITSSGQHLLSVVNSLLDMSKIEAGRFDLNPEPFALDELVASCCEMVGLKADQAGIAMVRRLDPALPEVMGDKRACKQIVINLLSNALKFTPEGGAVTVEARPYGNSVLLTVTDTGIGIAPRDLGRLGDAFFQGQAGYDRIYEGTGLGLSVVRGLVGLHGGTISVESALGEGTRVAVLLPLDCRAAPYPRASARIEVISRYTRSHLPAPGSDTSKVQKVA